LGIAGRAVSSRMSLPILSSILVATEGGRLRLSATNLEIAITCWVGAKVQEEGAIAVPARPFIDFVSTLNPGPLDLSVDAGTQTLHLQSGRTRANLKGNSADDFPGQVRVGDEETIEIDSVALRDVIAQVAFAAAPDTERPILAGVLAEFEGKALSLVATDGFRLSLRRQELGRDLGTRTQVIIPARALSEVARVAADGQQPVRMTVLKERSQVVFQVDDVEIVSQLVEGLFPPHKQIIPKSHLTRTVVNTKEFQAAVRRASVFARGANNIVRLQLFAEDAGQPSHMAVSAVAADLGDNVADVDAMVEGESVRTAFNSRYLLDLLDVVHTENLILETSSPSSPGVFRPVGPEAEDFTHIIMPMYVPE